MKKLTMLLFTVMIFAVYANAQSLNCYKAANGVTYKVGDTVKLNTGSAKDGSFSCVVLGGWAAAMGYDQNGASNQFKINGDYANSPFIIKKIDWEYIKGGAAKRYYFVVGDEGTNDYNLYIDAAVKTHEVLPFNMQTAVAVQK
jgi:hypothetical protein